jgi:hypothetical protein
MSPFQEVDPGPKGTQYQTQAFVRIEKIKDTQVKLVKKGIDYFFDDLMKQFF